MITVSTSGLVVLMVAGYLGIHSVVNGVKRMARKIEERENRKDRDWRD